MVTKSSPSRQVASTAHPIKPTAEKDVLCAGHRERLREKLLKSRMGELPDYEILEALLCLARPRMDMKPVAKELLQGRTFAQLLSLDYQQLIHMKNIGANTAAIIRLVQEAAVRMVREDAFRKPILQSWYNVIDYCRATMANKATESMRILYLNKSYMLIDDEFQEYGTVDEISIFPREISKKALMLDASYVVLAHNHPSGNMAPSHSDIIATQQLSKALNLLQIKLHDHVIVTSKGHYSFKESGLV